MIWLLDGNALVAFSIGNHPLHARTTKWLRQFLDAGNGFATCPTTEGTLLRMHMQLSEAGTATAAWGALDDIQSIPEHVSWIDNFSYRELRHRHLQGHKQVTDAWLVDLARRRGGKLATLDVPLATLYPDVAILIPVLP